MGDTFLGEIRIYPYGFEPKGWRLCDGRLMSIAENNALYAIIGTTYGGDGYTNFALPNLTGRVPVHHGQGPGLSSYTLGEQGGERTVTLSQQELPRHTHLARVGAIADTTSPQQGVWATATAAPNLPLYGAPESGFTAEENGFTHTGSNQAHDNMAPFLTLGFHIAVQGIFPPRP